MVRTIFVEGGLFSGETIITPVTYLRMKVQQHFADFEMGTSQTWVLKAWKLATLA